MTNTTTKYQFATIRRYSVLIPGKRPKDTDDIELARKWAAIHDGTIYEQTRYNALKRLQRMYYQKVVWGNTPLDTLDYPSLLKISHQ